MATSSKNESFKKVQFPEFPSGGSSGKFRFHPWLPPAAGIGVGHGSPPSSFGPVLGSTSPPVQPVNLVAGSGHGHDSVPTGPSSSGSGSGGPSGIISHSINSIINGR